VEGLPADVGDGQWLGGHLPDELVGVDLEVLGQPGQPTLLGTENLRCLGRSARSYSEHRSSGGGFHRRQISLRLTCRG
jgi:hypothetical protein